MKSQTVPFDIHIPATADCAALKVTSIDIEIYRDEQGNEMVTPESTELIEKTQARYTAAHHFVCEFEILNPTGLPTAFPRFFTPSEFHK